MYATQYGWPQAGPTYAHYGAADPGLAASYGDPHAVYGAPPGYVQPWGQQVPPGSYAQVPHQYMQQQQPLQQQQFDPVDAFMQELGIHPEEVVHFGWIAEYGLQSDVLPPRWTAHMDPNSGRTFYVDSTTGGSSWESPIAPTLRAAIDQGRLFLQTGGENFFEEQKQLLWEHHKQTLEAWHGPYTDEEGRGYFINNVDGTSSWQDPRQETQTMHELERTLLDALRDTLPAPEVDDSLPGFGLTDDQVRRRARMSESFELQHAESQDEQGTMAQVPTLGDTYGGISVDRESSCGDGSPTSHSRNDKRAKRSNAMLQVARQRCERAGRIENKDPSGSRTAYKRIVETMEKMDYIVKDEAEAQFLLIKRRFKQRREQKRKREREEHEAKYGEEWRRALEAMEAAKREEEARKKAEADEEERRKAQAFQQQQEEERAAEEKRKREEEERARAEAVRQQVLAEKAAKEEEERRQEEERRRAKAKRDDLLKRLKDVVTSHSVDALRSTIAEGEAEGLLEEVKPAKKALEEEMARRKGAALKARKQAEKLASEFKDAKEAQDFGGAILAAQWRAAVKEISKPFQEEN